MTARKKYLELFIGESARFKVKITRTTVRKFSDFSGDKNPIHIDRNYAKKTIFGKPIAHGMLAGSFFSRLIGMNLPGNDSLYLSQQLNFRKAIIFPAEVIVEGKITQKVDSLKLLKIKTTIYDQKTAITYIDGEALVKMIE